MKRGRKRERERERGKRKEVRDGDIPRTEALRFALATSTPPTGRLFEVTRLPVPVPAAIWMNLGNCHRYRYFLPSDW